MNTQHFLKALCAGLAAVVLASPDAAAGLSIEMTNTITVTTTSAVVRVKVATNDQTSAYVWLYWGLTNNGNNATWPNTNAIGLVTNSAVQSVSLAGLTSGTTYWATAYATNGATNAWATWQTNFNTLATYSPTSVLVTAYPDGKIRGPTNFLSANGVLTAESDPLSLHTQSLLLAWSPSGGSYTDTQTIASSHLLTNGYATTTYTATGTCSLVIQMSTDSNTWATAAATNGPVYIRLAASDPPAEGSITISNIAVYSWLYPALWHARPDLMGQTVLTDTPSEARQVVNKTYVDTLVSNNTPSAWASYPAIAPVDLGSNALLFAASYSLLSSGSYTALSYGSASLGVSNESFAIQCSGSDVISIAGTNILLAITNFWIDTSNHFNASVWTGGVIYAPYIQYTTNLLNQRWMPVTLASNSYPAETDASYFLRWTNSFSSPTYFRAACSVSPNALVTIFGSLTVLGGGNVVTNLAPGVLDPWHDVYTISTYTLGTVYVSRANGEYQRLVPTNNVTICMDQPTFPAMGVPLLYLGVSNAAFTIALGTNTISTNSASQYPSGSSGVTFSNNWENAILLERAYGSTTTLWGVKQVR